MTHGELDQFIEETPGLFRARDLKTVKIDEAEFAKYSFENRFKGYLNKSYKEIYKRLPETFTWMDVRNTTPDTSVVRFIGACLAGDLVEKLGNRRYKKKLK